MRLIRQSSPSEVEGRRPTRRPSTPLGQLSLLLGALALAGCFVPPADGVQGLLVVVRSDCAGGDAAAGAVDFRLTVGERTEIFRAGDSLPSTIACSPGPGRRAVLEARDAAGKVIAIARSAVQTVDAEHAPVWTLRLRPVEAFSPACRMTEARAGAASVVLDDGQVWLAGGVGVASTERFDGSRFTATAPLGVSNTMLPRAFATATGLPNGQVVVWGGEAGAGASSTIVLVYDPPLDAFGALVPRTAPPNVARSRHFSVRVAGMVVSVGGGTESVESFDPTTNQLAIDGTWPSARAGATFALSDPSTVVVAGGTPASAQVDLLRLVAPKTAIRSLLTTARSAAASARAGAGVLIAGGENATGPLTSSEWVDATGKVWPGPAVAPRAEACAVTLEDGRALFVGGRAGAAPVADAELVDGALAVTKLVFPGAARVHATCTLMPDGAVLVAGGRSVNGALDDAWVFTPRP